MNLNKSREGGVMRLSKKQKKIARAAAPFNRITGADFRKLKRRKNVKKKKVKRK